MFVQESATSGQTSRLECSLSGWMSQVCIQSTIVVLKYHLFIQKNNVFVFAFYCAAIRSARIYRHTYTCRICMCRYIMDIVCVHTHLMYIVCVHIHISVVISRSFFFFEKKALLVTTDIMYIVCVYIYISCI